MNDEHDPATDAAPPAEDTAPTKKKRTTRKKAAAKKTTRKKAGTKSAEPTDDAPRAVTPDPESPETGAAKKKTKKASRKKASKKTSKKVAAADDAEAEDATDSEPSARPEPEPEADASGEADAGTDREDDAPDGSDTEAGSDAPKGKKRRRRRKKASSKSSGGDDSAEAASEARADDDDDSPEPEGEGRLEMIINYVPGEECRVAITEDGQLEELFAEPTDRLSRVGNIYVGKIVNVEASIQAAFVDFGCEENGFLHISDLHPQYFGDDDDATERVGKKTPRRDRPPIQEALRRGQEITVQVLKEGVGTKGPTLTSYLSIPGRFLVMMPGMDKVGVSRKEEDDERRRAARDILAQLDLPEGFGFILRTAGFDRTKAELKRDLAYLMRLWKDMERRRKGGNKPRPLYSESDLLLRSIRDLMTSEVKRVVIDSEPALRRAAQFIKIAAPRTQVKLSHYVGGAPIFHAFGIEEQIEAIHAREVPLPSGGRLVIDQTEALVAIDVNSGKSRSARDAETNAFRTNMEAVDAICRQLMLRDLGGLVVNDLIDMRYASHRKQVEQRFRDRLKRDRAKSTIGSISEFGLLEMTRQRMRGSMESQHFSDCPMCRGRGLVQKPDSVAATALRDLAAIVDHEKVHKVEMVVNPRVAGALLSTRRTGLTRIELHTGKQIDVRVSDTLSLDRVTFYAYDQHGADLALEKASGRKRPAPKVVDWQDDEPDSGWAVDPADEADETTAKKLAEEIARLAAEAGPKAAAPPASEDADAESSGTGKKKRRRRRRRKGKGDGEGDGSGDGSGDGESGSGDAAPDAPRDDDRSTGSPPAEGDARESADEDDNRDGEGGGKKKRRRRRRRGRGRSGDGDAGSDESDGRADDSAARRTPAPEPKPEAKPEAKQEPKPKRRGLYSGARRKLAPSEVARISPD
ncbi:MAG: Rne/Rng family ribonuclease [Phycisphaerales bacterium]|nr:Rne/Rng family ribonuclease [Planctomycetota bacterium]MCH8508143.1 Rne/Rng family ribonuclease [Phycisphaerales bacterium]